MSETLHDSRLRTRFYVHLPPISLRLPQVPFDGERFPSLRNGFENFSMATEVSYFGLRMSLVDLSGLEHDQVARRLRTELGAHLLTEPIRFLQTLEYLEGPYGLSAHPDLAFNQIVAYHGPGETCLSVAELLPSGGWKLIPEPTVLGGWAPGTLGLFFADSL